MQVNSNSHGASDSITIECSDSHHQHHEDIEFYTPEEATSPLHQSQDALVRSLTNQANCDLIMNGEEEYVDSSEDESSESTMLFIENDLRYMEP
jgi:hypothetical protein